MVMFEVTPEEVKEIEDAFKKYDIPEKAMFFQTVYQKRFLSVCCLMSHEKKRLAEKIVSGIVFGIAR